MTNKTKKLAVFASGNGSNAEAIFEYFKHNADIEVSLLLSNKTDAFVIQRAQLHGIPVEVVTRDQFYHSDKVVALLKRKAIDLVVLAGFLWLLPGSLVKAYGGKIINLHPALLPKFGGKGMFGIHVHQAVLNAGEKETGITIHYVNENYDEGKIILQERCKIERDDKPEDIAKKVQQLEHRYYPKVIADIFRK